MKHSKNGHFEKMSKNPQQQNEKKTIPCNEATLSEEVLQPREPHQTFIF